MHNVWRETCCAGSVIRPDNKNSFIFRRYLYI